MQRPKRALVCCYNYFRARRARWDPHVWLSQRKQAKNGMMGEDPTTTTTGEERKEESAMLLLLEGRGDG